jgi:cytochrome c peroxidase
VKIRIIIILVLIIAAGFKTDFHPSPYKFPELVFFPEMPRSKENRVTMEGAELGRYLFYDSILSINRNFSCGSCHRQGAAFSDAPNTFSKGHNGTLQKRNTMPLFNLAWYPALFWDGRASGIEEQALFPVRDHAEMDLKWTVATERISKSRFYRQKFKAVFGDVPIDSLLIAKAIAQFERTLLSYNAKFDRATHGKALFTKDERAGYELVNDMTRGDCLHCHTTDGDALGTTGAFSNNGLDQVENPLNYADKGRGAATNNAVDLGKFKIPSIRNLAFTAPYMHDGRFKTLEEVIDFYSNGVKPCANIDSKMEFVRHGGAHFSAEEKRQIISFLLTLSDSVFVNDAAFSNPFKKTNRK